MVNYNKLKKKLLQKYPKKPTEKQKQDYKEYIRYLYTNTKSPVAFTSPIAIKKELNRRGHYVNTGVYRIKKILSEIPSYSVYAHHSKHKKSDSTVFVAGMCQQLSGDLADVSKYKSDNDGISYLLIVINDFTKYVYVEPLINKEGQTVAKAMDKILSQEKTYTLCLDMGSEFKSFAFKNILKKHGVTPFYASGTGKCTTVERFIRNIRSFIAKYIAENKTEHYIDALPDFIYNYNNYRTHRSTKSIPSEVNRSNEFMVYNNLYYDKLKLKKKTHYKFKLGSHVRVASSKEHLFKREAYERFSNEIFIISDRHRNFQNINLYTLSDCSGDILTGFFNEKELIEVNVDENTIFPIEQILDEKLVNKIPMLLVQWEGFPKKCASWIEKRTVLDLPKK